MVDKAQSRDQCLDWLDAIEQRGVNLTVYEETFVENMRITLQSNKNATLTLRQAQVLERIYAERTP